MFGFFYVCFGCFFFCWTAKYTNSNIFSYHRVSRILNAYAPATQCSYIYVSRPTAIVIGSRWHYIESFTREPDEHHMHLYVSDCAGAPALPASTHHLSKVHVSTHVRWGANTYVYINCCGPSLIQPASACDDALRHESRNDQSVGQRCRFLTRITADRARTRALRVHVLH